MRNFWVFFALILVFLSFEEGYAQESIPYIWTPERIITGEVYEGVVALDVASRLGQVVVLSSSDPTVVEIPQSVTILANSNHGIFSIKPLREGEIRIFAVVDGKIVSTNLFVYSSSRQSEGLKIVLPSNSTKTETVIGYVLSVDANGSPAPMTKDTVVMLSATPMIEFESSKLQIKSGDYYAKFIAKIRASGKIFASSENHRVAEYDISRIQENVSVMVAVAPNIVLENSKAYFFVWLEKDGKPYKPPYVVHAYLSSSNLKSIRFNENSQIKQHSDSILKVSVVDGVGTGYLISQNRGSSVITASVGEFGSAQTNVIVGPVLLDNNFEFVEPNDDDKIGQIESKKPNVAFAWFYPEITDSKAYGVVALYQMNFTQKMTTTITTNNTDVLVSNTINRVVPVPIDGRTISLSSSSGLRHPEVLVLSESNEILLKRGIGSTHASQFEVVGLEEGNHTISVSGPGLEMFESNLVVIPPFRNAYKLNLTSIPTMSDKNNYLALISVVDESGALINAQKMFGGPLKVGVFSDREQSELRISSSNSAVYSGILNDNTKVVVFAEGFAPIEEKIIPSDIASSVVLDVPQKIHIYEPIPYSIHELDSNGIPIRKLNSTNISATAGVAFDNNYLVVDDVGTENIAVVTEIGADSKQIDSFANTFNFEIITNGITNRIDKDFEIRLESDVKDFEVIVDLPIPFEKTDDATYLITPNREGNHNITFTALKQGYAPARNSFSTFIEKFVNLTLRAVASDGADLNIGQTIRLGNISKVIVTPHQEETKPQFLEIKFPSDFVVGNKGYQLEGVIFEDQKVADGKINNIFLGKNTDIIARYQRMVKIDVENAQGSGFYPYGKTVILSVPPKDKFFFLIRDIFDHWEGLEQTTDNVSFVATKDISAKAVLREDHTFLTLLLTSGASLFLYNNFVRRKRISLSFYFERFDWSYFDKVLK
jgi:hypothetical protein